MQTGADQRDHPELDHLAKYTVVSGAPGADISPTNNPTYPHYSEDRGTYLNSKLVQVRRLNTSLTMRTLVAAVRHTNTTQQLLLMRAGVSCLLLRNNINIPTRSHSTQGDA